MKLSPFNVAQKILQLNGQPFNLKDREYLRPIYESPHPRILLKTARQSEKTSTLAALMAVYGAVIPAFKILYVSPTSDQTRVFSNVKLKEFLDSPFIKKNLIDKNCPQAVFFKQLKNNSAYTLRYCFLTSDRVRGISSDWCFVDEIQDIITSHIPVIEESCSHSSWKHFMYAGTPKTIENSIEYYWKHSTQRELCVKCSHCNHWNIGLGIKNIGQDGLICASCERRLDKTHYEWVRAVPLDKSTYDGFRFNQLFTPWIDWKDILVKQKVYDAARFHNEVLAEAYDSGQKPITMGELVSCCASRQMSDPDFHDRFSSPMFASVDWSVTSDVSFTVLTIGSFEPYPDKFRIYYAKIYDGSMKDPREQVKDIIDICKKFEITLISADWGSGNVTNLSLVDAFGMSRVIQFFNVGSQQERIKWNKKRLIYTINRTFTMGDMFTRLIKGNVEFFNWDQFQPFANHILNIYQDVKVSQQREMLYYDHRIDMPDDYFHALNMCILGAQIFYEGRAI